MSKTKPKINTVKKSVFKIISDNIFYNNGRVTAYYILPSVNYSITSSDYALDSIESLTNLLSGLASQRPGLAFTISKLDKTISSDDVKKNLYDTIRLYREDYEMPDEFLGLTKRSVQSYSLLKVEMSHRDIMNVEEYSIKEVIKELFGTITSKILGNYSNEIHEERYIEIEKNIYNAIRSKCVRASKDIVFHDYVSRLYPSYDISYSSSSFINDENFDGILGSITQTITDEFGSFVMSNQGVDLFDMPIIETYGCMLDVMEFPLRIDSSNFPMDFPGCTVAIKILKKDEAAIKLKRSRSSDRYDLKEAEKADAEIEQLEETVDSIKIATKALKDLEEGETLCKFSYNILVTARTREELKTKVMAVITKCKDRNILVSKSLTQSRDFLDCYVNQESKKQIHFANLQMPLSFQLNSGSIVGDGDLSIYSPAIGDDSVG